MPNIFNYNSSDFNIRDDVLCNTMFTISRSKWMARVHLCECHYFFCSRLWRSFSCYTCNEDGFIGRGVLWSDNDKLFLGDSFEKGHSVMINVMVE